MTFPRLRLSPSGPRLGFELPRTDDVLNVSTIPGLDVTTALDVAYERRINYLDVLDGPVALWNFSDTLSAVIGPTFSGAAGSYGFSDIYPGTRGLQIEIGARLTAAPAPSLVQLGAMSCEVILLQNGGTPPLWICGVAGPAASGSASNNTAWSLSVPGRNVSIDWENGTGSAVSFATSTAAGAAGLPPVHNILSFGFSRSASGVVQPYFNGRVFGNASSPLALPTGGSSGTLTLGARSGAVSTLNYALISLAIYDRARPASEWLDSYNRSVGNGLGFITA